MLVLSSFQTISEVARCVASVLYMMSRLLNKSRKRSNGENPTFALTDDVINKDKVMAA